MGITAVAILVVLAGPNTAEALIYETQPAPTANTRAFTGQGELAFVSGSTLYVLDGSSRSLHAVTTGEADPVDPTFSHDGRWLAFLRPSASGDADVLWMARGNGAEAHPVRGVPEALTVPDSDGTVISWSPTRDDLLVTTGPITGAPLVPRQVWIVSPSSPPHRLLGPGYVNGVAWSPDGSHVAAVWSSTGFDSEVLETLPASGGHPMRWTAPNGNVSYFLAGWSHPLGIVLWENQGGGGPSVENYGLPLGVISAPGAIVKVLGTVPIFQPPALALGADDLALVVNGNPSSGQGEGEKFVWFGKSLALCTPSQSCTAVPLPGTSVVQDPAISSDGSLAVVVAPESDVDLPPLYSSSASWAQVSAWYDSGALWITQSGSTSPTEIDGTNGAIDPVFSGSTAGLIFVKDQSLWLLPSPSAQPIQITGSLEVPLGSYLFGYIDWQQEFAWWS